MIDTLWLAEHKRYDWIVEAPSDTQISDLKGPEFWSLVADKLSPFDLIEVRAEDKSWVAFLIVAVVGEGWAKCLIREYNLLM